VIYYTLDSAGNPVPSTMIGVSDLFDNIDRRTVKKTKIGRVEVSTVFLCLDHNFTGSGDPVLWETMIFGGKHDGYCDRYSSLAEAKAGHETACSIVRGSAGEKLVKLGGRKIG
jgi:hypothetical protein